MPRGRLPHCSVKLMDRKRVAPWPGLQPMVAPHYAKAGNTQQPGRLSIILRIYFAQQWFNVSDTEEWCSHCNYMLSLFISRSQVD